ncbi:hypothetical protein SLEP1_g35190 [Rubroshorea leprosula]|uniref:SBP-type domain-containing protein n=1 Tax=Rubroshorea leprosula TaxID=152421 RepID=A0AAV5KMQ7_9ROSI|nr:hypothetical protein SLEP1_g35190 [Rubroshorea leprosula]
MGSMGSGSMTDQSGGSSSNSFTESPNGLKFGQKIYFKDDVSAGGAGIAPPKSGSGSSSSGSGRRTRGGGLVQGAQPPRCQVEGCQADLTDAKAYYSRHKVCGMHSKSSMVIVAGLQQRFCQQCSRFHQLPEFDQGKRSCRRRLAGHNERRRKPPPGSLFPSRYGRLSSSFSDNSSRSGGFMVDFTAYPRHSGRDAWPTARAPELVRGNHNTTAGRPIPNPWQGSSENPTSELFLQGSAGGTGFSSPGISPGECFTAVADSSCALSLLSNQTWGSRNQTSGLVVNDFMNAEGVSVAQPAPPHGGAALNNFPNTSWGFKGNDAGSSSHEMVPNLCLGQMSQPIGNQYPAGPELSQQSRRHYIELEYSRAYDSSTEHAHWSL